MKTFFSFALFLSAVSCQIMEEDLSGRPVELLRPASGATVPAGMTHFRWHALDHATGYELWVETAGRIVADTLLAADTLGMARSYGCLLRLEAGEYQWTVAAFNSGYEVRSATLHLTVVEAAQQPVDPDTAPDEKPFEP